MPWWAAGYFGLYLAFSGWSLIDDYRTKEPPWFMTAEVVSDICLLAPAFAFWIPDAHAVMKPFLLPVFATGVLLLCGLLVRTLAKQLSDPALGKQGKAFVVIGGSALVALVSTPMLLWGYRAAVLGGYVDA